MPKLPSPFLFYTMTDIEHVMAYINQVRQISSYLKSMYVDIIDQELGITVMCGQNIKV